MPFDCAVRFFVRLYKLSAGRLTPVKRNLGKMAEKMQASVGNRTLQGERQSAARTPRNRALTQQRR